MNKACTHLYRCDVDVNISQWTIYTTKEQNLILATETIDLCITLQLQIIRPVLTPKVKHREAIFLCTTTVEFLYTSHSQSLLTLVQCWRRNRWVVYWYSDPRVITTVSWSLTVDSNRPVFNCSLVSGLILPVISSHR